MDGRDSLAEEHFSYQSRADGSVLISYHSAPVTVLRGKTAARFMSRLSDADAGAAQQLMARATGNFNRANERKASEG